MNYIDLRKQINELHKADFNTVNIAVISNITLEPYFDTLLSKKFAEISINTNIIMVNYENAMSDACIESLQKSELIVIIINFDYMFPDVINDIYSGKINVLEFEEQCFRILCTFYSYIKKYVTNPIIWFGFEDYCYMITKVKGYVPICGNIVETINSRILKILCAHDVFINLNHLLASVGTENSYDYKGKFRWNAPYSDDVISKISSQIYNQYLINKRMTKKCIVLDCDNVLWGGILSEDGYENINLSNSGYGRIFKDFQRFILHMYYHGVIIAICSKNDLADVRIMFSKHSDMVLKEEHIACFAVNWKNKADNIRFIANNLNIGLDSIVFIDDSVFEIKLVQFLLPEVTTITFTHDKIYNHFRCFNLENEIDVENIELRNMTYKTDHNRAKLKTEVSDYVAYLKALKIKISIQESIPIEYKRISELSQRTNKCTNGRRYTINEVKQIISSQINFYSGSVADKFSDLGLVGAFCIRGTKLDLFCLSCRALGRNIEDEIIGFIKSNFHIADIYYHDTAKNTDIYIKIQRNLLQT